MGSLLNGVLGGALAKKAAKLNDCGFPVCGGKFACAGAGKIKELADGTMVLGCGNHKREVTATEAAGCHNRTEHKH